MPPKKTTHRSPFGKCKWCNSPIEWAQDPEGKWSPNVVGTNTRHFCKNGRPVSAPDTEAYTHVR